MHYDLRFHIVMAVMILWGLLEIDLLPQRKSQAFS